ncbi:MAG: diacylglycerol kinase family protein [Pirellulales bacterium]
MHIPHKTSWLRKFACAFRGIAVGIRAQNSFYVHIPVTAGAIAAAWWLDVSRIEWCLLVLCIGAVVASEMFNTAIEDLAKAITREQNPHLRDALDAASGAVLIGALTAAGVGALVLVSHFWS